MAHRLAEVDESVSHYQAELRKGTVRFQATASILTSRVDRIEGWIVRVNSRSASERKAGRFNSRLELRHYRGTDVRRMVGKPEFGGGSIGESGTGDGEG